MQISPTWDKFGHSILFWSFSPVSLLASKLPVDSFTMLGTDIRDSTGLGGSATALSTELVVFPTGHRILQRVSVFLPVSEIKAVSRVDRAASPFCCVSESFLSSSRGEWDASAGSWGSSSLEP